MHGGIGTTQDPTLAVRAVRTAQKMRSHFAPSWAGSGMVEEKFATTSAPDFALVR